MKQGKKKEDMSLVLKDAEKLAEEDLKGLVPLRSKIAKLKMNNDENYQIVMDEGRKAKDIHRQVLARRKKPLLLIKQLKTDVELLFKPMIEECKEFLELVGEKREEYSEFLEEKRIKEQRMEEEVAERERKRLQKNANARAKRSKSEAQAAEIRCSVEPVEVRQVEKEAPARVEGVSVAKIWDFEIEDPSVVPEHFEELGGLIVLWERKFNRSALMSALRHVYADGFDPETQEQPIPGVRFFRKPSIKYRGL